MRIALLADIHGNLVALETVLHEVAKEPVDQITCLGDVGALGPQPHEVIDRLCHLHCPVILGNTDAWLLSPPGAKTSDSETLRIITSWCAEQLTPEDPSYLHTFSPLLELPLDEGRTLIFWFELVCQSSRSFPPVLSWLDPPVEVRL